MSSNYCRECGTKLVPKELENEGIVPYCPSCGQFRFPQYNVAVSMVVINEEKDEILLIKQYGKPWYILVAGYVARGESLEETVAREVREETGMTVSHIKFNRTQFYEKSDVLMCNFTAFVNDTSEFAPNYEIDSYAWFTREEARRNVRPCCLIALISRRKTRPFTAPTSITATDSKGFRAAPSRICASIRTVTSIRT